MGFTDPKTVVSADDIEVYNPTSSTVAVSDEKREAHEVFKKTEDGVEFRTVSWQRATIIFLKIQFAMSILSVPGSLAALGAVGGALSIVGWDVLNTCKWKAVVGNDAVTPDEDFGRSTSNES